MVNSLVARATSDMLIGPDWAMNIEICDICNQDPVQAKEIIKGIKKRLGSKNPKVQLLALTLLEAVVKNCGDFVHMDVAKRNLLNDMVKIVKKKHPDFHVKEKILILIDTWQEAFGGARSRYPQYYAAYHDLLRLGANFPQKSESAPVFTPPQTQPLSSYQNNLGNPETENEAIPRSARSADAADVSTLSLTEMQNARGIMDVLAEMLAAVDPQKKEGLKQEVIVDLVEQCRDYKKRVVHLVNSTSDESLLSLGLALNDDLQRVLTKHEALITGKHVQPEKSKPETSQALVPVDTPLIDTKNSGSASRNVAELDLISLAPITTNGKSTTPEKVNVNFDLLSGDDFDSPIASNALAIVPVGPPQPSTPVSQNNALALINTFSPQTQKPQNGAFYPSQYGSWAPYDHGNNRAWNGNMSQQQQQQSFAGFGAATSGGLPPPPWEGQPPNNHLPPANNPFQSMHNQMPPMHNQFPPMNNQMAPMNNQMPPIYNHISQMHNQMPPMNNQMPPMNNQIPPMNNQMPPMYNQISQMNNQMSPMNSRMPPMNTHMPPMHNQMPPMNNQMPPMNNQPLHPNQLPQQQFQQQQQQMAYYLMAQQMYNNQTGQASGNGYGYGYGSQQNAQYIDPRMSGTSTSTVYTGPSMANASYVHTPSEKGQKPEDRLFGDLVDFSKVKHNKTS